MILMSRQRRLWSMKTMTGASAWWTRMRAMWGAGGSQQVATGISGAAVEEAAEVTEDKGESLKELMAKIGKL